MNVEQLRPCRPLAFHNVRKGRLGFAWAWLLRFHNQSLAYLENDKTLKAFHLKLYSFTKRLFSEKALVLLSGGICLLILVIKSL